MKIPSGKFWQNCRLFASAVTAGLWSGRRKPRKWNQDTGTFLICMPCIQAEKITEEKPELFEAAKKTLNTRLANGGGHTGWSRAWVTCFFARLKEGDKVGESIEKMFATCIKDNLLDTHPPFQIDGNFGIPEAMLEGLVQSHAGYVEFLPALPPAWTEGSLKGVILEQGIAAEFSWKDKTDPDFPLL